MASIDLTRINSNIAALNTLNALRDVNKNLALHQSRLATGKRINEAADDPAGLTLATKFQVRTDSMQQAIDNIGDSKNLLSVAEGGLKKINEILGKMRIKAEAAATDTLGSSERTQIASQLTQFATEIDDIASQTKWNGSALLSASLSKTFQTGADYETTSFSLTQVHTSTALNVGIGVTARAAVLGAVGSTGISAPVAGAPATGNSELASGEYEIRVRDNAGTKQFRVFDQLGNAVSISSTAAGTGALTSDWQNIPDAATTWDTGRGFTFTHANQAGTAAGSAYVSYTAQGGSVSDNTNSNAYLANVDAAISTVSTSLNTVGSMVARLTYKEENLSTGKLNTEAAYNRIMNADMAMEQLESVKFGILQQTATAMLAQTNTAPQSVLSLFR